MGCSHHCHSRCRLFRYPLIELMVRYLIPLRCFRGARRSQLGRSARAYLHFVGFAKGLLSEFSRSVF